MNYIDNFKFKNTILVCLCVLLLSFSCKEASTKSIIQVANIEELNEAIKNANPGDNIVLANGVWKDVEIKFRGQGTKENPIVLKAETNGKVSIEGKSYLEFGGQFLEVKGLHFKNGYSPSRAVIDFRII